jgi:hypothetical protein
VRKHSSAVRLAPSLQYTSKASTQFNQLGHELFWETAHWLGRKFKIAMPVVMQRFNRDNTFVSGKLCLLKPAEFPALRYQQRFFKPNPYLTQQRVLSRENLPVESYWSGYEARPGMADLLPLIRERDEGVCQNCGISVIASTAEIDHIRPVRRGIVKCCGRTGLIRRPPSPSLPHFCAADFHRQPSPGPGRAAADAGRSACANALRPSPTACTP